MPRQQKIRHPLQHLILMRAVPTHELPLLDRRLQQYPMQIPRRLARYLFHCFGAVGGTGRTGSRLDEVLAGRRCDGERGESKLYDYQLSPVPMFREELNRQRKGKRMHVVLKHDNIPAQSIARAYQGSLHLDNVPQRLCRASPPT